MGKYKRLLAIGIALGILAIIVVTLLSDVSQLGKYVTAFPWLLMLPALGLRLCNWTLRFFKWHFYLRLVGAKDVSLADSAAVYFAGFPLAMSPGKAAEILKSFILYNMSGTPVATTLPIVAAERLSDGLAVIVLIAIAILNLAANQYWPVVAIPLLMFGIGIVVLQIRPLCMAILRLLERLPLIGKFAHHFALFYESSYKIVLLPNLVIAVGLGTVANFLDGVGVFFILAGLGLPPTSELFFQALLLISLSVVAGSLSGMPGSVGAADLTIAGSLAALVNLGAAQVGFATLLIRFVQLWFGVLFGTAVAFLARKRLFPPDLAETIAEQEARLEAQGEMRPSQAFEPATD